VLHIPLHPLLADPILPPSPAPGNSPLGTKAAHSRATVRPAAAPVLTRVSLSDIKRPIPQCLSFEASNCGLAFSLGRHFHKRKSLGLPTTPVFYNSYRCDSPKSQEFLPQFSFSYLTRQVAHIDVHIGTPFILPGMIAFVLLPLLRPEWHIPQPKPSLLFP